MRRLTSLFNFLAAAMTVGLLAIIVVHANLATATREAMERSSRYDSAWVGAAGRMEILYLQKALGSFINVPSADNAAEVDLFSDMMANRFKICETPGFQAFAMEMETDMRACAIVGSITAMANSWASR